MSDSWDRIDALRLRSLKAAWLPDQDAIIRRIFRWYSREFSTPLHTVPDLPLEDVLIHWFESQFENLDPEEKHNLAITLLEDPKEKLEREAAERESEEQFYLQTKKVMEAQAAKRNLAKKVADMQQKLKKLGDTVENAKNTIVHAAPKMPVALGNAEDIVTISFSEGNLEDVAEDGLPLPPPRKKA